MKLGTQRRGRGASAAPSSRVEQACGCSRPHPTKGPAACRPPTTRSAFRERGSQTRLPERYASSTGYLTSVRTGFSTMRPSGTRVDEVFENETQTRIRKSFRRPSSSEPGSDE